MAILFTATNTKKKTKKHITCSVNKKKHITCSKKKNILLENKLCFKKDLLHLLNITIIIF